MKASLRVESNPTVESLRIQVEAMFAALGDAAVSTIVPRKLITTSETRVAHGFAGTPSWWVPLSPDGVARIWQTRAPDSKYLYLSSTSPMSAGFLVF